MTLKTLPLAAICLLLFTTNLSAQTELQRSFLNPAARSRLDSQQREAKRSLKENRGILRAYGPVSIGTKVAYVVCTELDLHSSRGGYETNSLFRNSRGGVSANLNRLVSYGILGLLTLAERWQPEIAIVTTGVVAGGRCAVAAKNY